MTIIKAIQILSTQRWVEQFGWTLIHFLWQGAIIAAAYAVARRSRNPQFRCLLACLALAAMTISPIVTFAISGAPESSQAASFTHVTAVPVHAEATPTSLPIYISETWHEDVMPWLVMAWFAGAVIFWTRLTGGWIVASRMRGMLVRPAPAEWQRKLDELKTRIRISQPVRLLTSAIVQVPTVVGWLRPVILMPIAALAGLPIEQIEALLAHELAHIRRHDYLVNILQSVAEALLFYHPAVWWISTQIRNDRELCCDDVAVAISGDELIYARALADLEQHRPAHLNPALAANGGSLADRIGRLLGQSRSPSRTMPGPGILFATFLLAITAYGLLAQTNPRTPANSDAKLEFEAASVKPVDTSRGFPEGISGGPGTSDPHRISFTNPLKGLLMGAYGVGSDYISVPAWLNASQQMYAIEATIRPGATKEQVSQMLQNLLNQRFQMTIHRETRDVPLYELTVTGKGPRLKQYVAGSYAANGRGLREGFPIQTVSDGINHVLANKVTVPQLINFLSFELKRSVVDKTGLTGLYNYNLDFMPVLPATGEDLSTASAPDFIAAVRGQLGMKLTARKGPIEIIVIDHAEKTPLEN